MATLTHAQLEDLWLLAGGLPQWADTAAAIAQAESGGCQYAQRGPRDIRPVKQCVYVHDPQRYVIGLWQINWTVHKQYDRADLFGTTYNANAAVAIANGGTDFTPWTSYRDGAYKQYLQNPGSTTPPPGTTVPPAAGSVAPQAHRGYADLRNSVNNHLPKQLERSHRTGLATLRAIGRKSKVGR